MTFQFQVSEVNFDILLGLFRVFRFPQARFLKAHNKEITKNVSDKICTFGIVCLEKSTTGTSTCIPLVKDVRY